MKPNKLRRYLRDLTSRTQREARGFLQKKITQLSCTKASVPSNAQLASYKVAYRAQKAWNSQQTTGCSTVRQHYRKVHL